MSHDLRRSQRGLLLRPEGSGSYEFQLRFNKVLVEGFLVIMHQGEYPGGCLGAYSVDSLGYLATLVYKLVGDRSGSVSPGSVAFYDSIIFPLSRIIDFLSIGSFGKNLTIVATKPTEPPHD